MIYIERPKIGLLSIDSLEEGFEYHPCESSAGGSVHIKDYDYYFELKDGVIYAYIEESVTPKYWDHKYISPKLYIESIKKAAAKHKQTDKVIGDSTEPEIMRVIFSSVIGQVPENFKLVADIIDSIDRIIDEVRIEAEAIIKRALIKYINS